MSTKIQLQALINLAISDMHLADEERDLIYSIGEANGIPRKDTDEMIADPKPIEELGDMSEKERFDLLYNLVQLMKVDRKVYVVEIKFCEELATRLGYGKKVVKMLSSKIFSNPSITTDRDHLFQLVRKHKDRT